MEVNRSTRLISPPPGSVSPPRTAPVPESSPPHTEHNNGGHISLSPPAGSPRISPSGSFSSPLHSKHSSGEHISLSPPIGSEGNSPSRSSHASDHISINQSPKASTEEEKPPSPEKKLALAVVSRDVFREPMENTVVLEELTGVERKAVVEEPKAAERKLDPVVGSGRRRFTPSLSILKRIKREKMMKKAALGFRVFGFVFCFVSLSVMAVDRNQGWALDSFDRYREFRYCMSVNVIGFVYSGAQAVDLSYNLATGKYIMNHQFRYYLDFAIDQMVAYVLISASSSAAIRVDDWQSNWGKDKFPDMATASVSMSFLAFLSLACSSLISGYTLCRSKSS